MSTSSLFEFEPLDAHGRATLAVDPAARGTGQVSPLLFGKFCEHLGRNIYQGMEAQILYNPTFAQSAATEASVRHLAKGLGWPDAGAVTASGQDGGALGWFRLGSKEDVLLSPDAGPHGAQAQRFESPGASAQVPKGIAQWTHLPLHRTRGYEFRLVGRAVRGCEVELALARIDSAGRPLGTIAAARVPLAPDWATRTGRLDVPADADIDPAGAFLLSITTNTPANVVLDRVLLYPDDHVDHADCDVIRLLTDARLSILRYPGGNFVSGHHWRDGVGPVDARPTYPNPVWRGVVESGLFGTDEFIAYCREVGCEPMICVNAGNGTPAEAADWVQYCNGAPDTPMGRLRAANGHPEPYRVRYWEIGNEIFGRHQIGWTTPAGNVDRFLRFSQAMRSADPTIRLLACGGLHLGVDAEWNQRLIHDTGGTADCQTHHILEGGEVDETADCKELFHAFMGYPIRIGQDYRLMRRRMLDAGIRDPRLAITELQLFASVRAHDRGGAIPSDMPTPATISEALYAMLIVHECIRLEGFMEMITHSATLNHGGGLRKVRERVWAQPVHYAHVMAAALGGGTPVGVRLACGTFSTRREFGHLPVVAGAPDLDALAVLTADGQDLICTLIHRSAHAGAIDLRIDPGGFPAGPEAKVLTLKGESLGDQNTYEHPDRIVPRPCSARLDGGQLSLTLPPYSLTRVSFPREQG